jgi:N-methylhydantoinase B
LAAVQRFWDQSDRAVRAIIKGMPDGRYEAESFLDDDGVNKGSPLPIKVVVIIAGDSMTVDLSGLAPEVKTGPWNAGYHGGAVAAVRIAAKMFFGIDEPANDGAFRAIDIVCPEGTFMSASATAPIAGSGHNLPSVVDTILAALGKAAPLRVPAAHHGTYGSQSMVARTLDGRDWMQHMESSAGGWGAAHDRDGNGPFRSVAHGDTPEVPIEVQETWGMFRLEHMKLRMDSGGAGLHRGGLGVERLYTVLRRINYSVVIERTKCPPWGVMGGKDGKPGRAEVYRGGVLLASLSKDDYLLEPGDQILFMSAGGGGYGDPRERQLDAVERDVLHGRVSTDAALEEYGVALVNGVASRQRAASPESETDTLVA